MADNEKFLKKLRKIFGRFRNKSLSLQCLIFKQFDYDTRNH